jgi:hypothetical protein
VDRAGPDHYPNRYPRGVGEMHEPDALVTTPSRKEIFAPFLSSSVDLLVPKKRGDGFRRSSLGHHANGLSWRSSARGPRS